MTSFIDTQNIDIAIIFLIFVIVFTVFSWGLSKIVLPFFIDPIKKNIDNLSGKLDNFTIDSHKRDIRFTQIESEIKSLENGIKDSESRIVNRVKNHNQNNSDGIVKQINELMNDYEETIKQIKKDNGTFK